ncbi:transposable element Tc3 transposase [Trichonephila clavipes]|nr:transposable element Tc3 transposase [Trichonephila clavipes]
MPRIRNRNAYQHIFDFDKGQIVACWDCGISYRSIAARAGRDLMTVSRMWNRWVQDGNMECRDGSQRPLSLAAEKAHQDGRIHVWRHRGQRTLTACIRHHLTGTSPSVMELWFQQDGATCHTARATIDLLKDTFGDRLISRFGSVNWPPRSCDLTPLDYFLWGYVKSLVYADKPQTLDHLKDNIRRVIADIRPQMLEKVIENWTSRLDYIRASRGSPMP